MIHRVCDHVSPPHGHEVRTWLATHPCLIERCTPVQVSWMNPVEQGFGLLLGKRLKIAGVASQDHLQAQVE
jgi:hypothetical protein